MLFAFAAASACGIAFGAFPAFQASSISGQQVVVRGRSGGASERSHRLRRALMIVEVALAVVLLTGAGLMMRTLQELTRVDAGFRSDHLLTVRASLAGPHWDTKPPRVSILRSVADASRRDSRRAARRNWIAASDRRVRLEFDLHRLGKTDPAASRAAIVCVYSGEYRLSGNAWDETCPRTAVRLAGQCNLTADDRRERNARAKDVARRRPDRPAAEARLARVEDAVARNRRHRRGREVPGAGRADADASLPAARSDAAE